MKSAEPYFCEELPINRFQSTMRINTPRPILRPYSIVALLAILAFPLLSSADSKASSSSTVLFIGNSFTYGGGSAVQFYRPQIVTDLNGSGKGGVPALFKAFTLQAGLDFEVSHELIGGSGIETHLEKKSSVVAKPWDFVVMHGYSTLNKSAPGDASVLVAAVEEMANLLHSQNPNVDIRLEATWSRADQTYPEKGHWYGKSIYAMAKDVRMGYNQAARNSPHVRGVIPVGEAWNRAMSTGVADPNPYDGIAYGQVDLWTHDHYHGGTPGYYLAALVIFGELAGLDPRSLGEQERAAFELGISKGQAAALQKVAFDELTAQFPDRELRSFEPSKLRF